MTCRCLWWASSHFAAAKAANKVTAKFQSNLSKLKDTNIIECFRLGRCRCADLLRDFGPRMASEICYTFMNINDL